jgi:hypothetical protein
VDSDSGNSCWLLGRYDFMSIPNNKNKHNSSCDHPLFICGLTHFEDLKPLRRRCDKAVFSSFLARTNRHSLNAS